MRSRTVSCDDLGMCGRLISGYACLQCVIICTMEFHRGATAEVSYLQEQRKNTS